MPIVLLGVLLIGGILFMSSGSIAASAKYPDIEPGSQGGDYDQTYDDSFYSAAMEFHVPFALIKAHAIRESSLKPNAFLADNRGGSYGLLQLSWGPGNERFAAYGYSSFLLDDGQMLYDPLVNSRIAAQLIKDNLKRFGNVKDAINAYNTGVAYSKRAAPVHYTEDVLKYYSEIVGRTVS